jgi:hypothetical protein
VLARLQVGDALADGHDVARALEAEDVRGPRRRVVVALPLQEVGTVDAGGGDPDQDLARCGLGGGTVDDLEGIDAARCGGSDSAHLMTVAGVRTRRPRWSAGTSRATAESRASAVRSGLT